MWKKLLLIISCIAIQNIYSQDLQDAFYSKNKKDLSRVIHNQANHDDENEILKIIVEFNDPPAVKLNKSMQRTITRNFRASQFQSDLINISAKLQNTLNKTNVQKISINKEFYKTFSGVQVDVPRSYLNYISGLSYVKKIHIDQKVSASLDESIPLINADKIWSELSNTGAGIKISIIDTGIDYLHEALGGGYGAGYKVIGGRDFINNDNDPMDDNGHGTHVAGIAAAKSASLKGVAPDALLIACKVLDAGGSGYSSSIIEAIDYSIDPNNDGDYSDAVDVINLSLGGPGTPDDPESQAVNNAVDLGVIVCAAAGNDGVMGYFTIGSPGCAQKVITVGNSTKYKELMSSSSKGPNLNNYNIKPDILAPGYLINSCKLSGGTIEYSGTSMASPHVAGVCALIRKQHPEWTPEEIKSAVKTTAEKLNYEPMQQGTGLIDAYKAMNAKTFISPTDLSFGKCDTTNAIWTTRKTIKVKNISSVQQQYSISNTTPQTGVSFAIDKQSFSLSSGDSTLVQISMSVNNSIVAFKNTGSNSYGGYLQIVSNNETLSLPWAFIKRQVVELKFELPNAGFSLTNIDSGKQYRAYNASWPDLYTAQLTIPGGNYDLISYAETSDSGFFCIKENLHITGAEVIVISKKDSKNKIHLDYKDEYGRKMIEQPNIMYSFSVFSLKGYTNYMPLIYHEKPYSFLISDIPEKFSLHFEILNEEGNVYRVINTSPVSNQTSDIYITNKPGDLAKQKVKFIFDKNVKNPILVSDTYSLYNNEACINGGNRTELQVSNWEGYIVRNKFECNNPSITYQMAALNTTPPEFCYSFLTNDIWARDGRLFMSSYNEITPDLFIETDPNKPIVIGDDVIFGSPNYTIESDTFIQEMNIYGQLLDLRSVHGHKYNFKAYNSSGAIIDSRQTEGASENKIGMKWDGNYLKTEFSQSNHSRFVDSSLSMLTSIIKNNSSDYAPPVITSFQIRNSEGKPVDEIYINEVVHLRFSLKDQNLNENSIKVEIKDYNSTNWSICGFEKIARHEKIGSLFSVRLDSSNFKNMRLMSIRVSYQDMNTNSGSWLLNPAVKINKANYYHPQLSSINDTTITEDSSLLLNISCYDQDNDPITYTLDSNLPAIKFEINNSILKITPPQNWFGTVDLCLRASDGKYSDSSKFRLIVTSVNDLPAKTSLYMPKNGFRLSITESNLKVKLLLACTKSSDADKDTLKYLFNYSIGSITVDSVTMENVLRIPYEVLNKYLADQNKNNLMLTWKVKVTDGHDTLQADNNPFIVDVFSTIVGVEEKNIPTNYCLYNAYPNPFNPTTTIEYDIIESSNVEVIIYNVLGKAVKTLIKEYQNPGKYKVRFNASDLSSGIYFYQLRTKNFTDVKKLMLIK